MDLNETLNLLSNISLTDKKKIQIKIEISTGEYCKTLTPRIIRIRQT